MKNKRLRTVLIWSLTIALITAFAYYLYSNADKYLELLNVSLTGVIGLILLSMVLPVLNGIQNTLLYRGLGNTSFSYVDGFLISATSSLANQLPIPGGIISKAYYLKRRYNLSYILFSSSTVALFICYLMLNGIIGLAILLFWIVFKKTTVSPVLLIGFGLMICSGLVFWVPLDRIKIPERMHEQIKRALDGWQIIRKKPLMTLKIMAIQFVLILFLSIRYWLAFRMLSQNVSVGQLLLMSSASILTQVVSIAPGGLGVREAIVGSIASILGFDAGVSLVAVGLDRLVSTLIKLIAGGISTVILSNQIAKMAPKTPVEEEVK